MTFRFCKDAVQPFELTEPKPEVCPLSVEALAHAAEGDADPLDAWEMNLASLILAAMATAPLACSVQTAERERYYAARSAVVEAQPGDGALRLTVWPRVGESRTTMATVEQTTDMP
jgi:hypothetical protein